jgi:dTDP-4-dehydrorhamnose 3,5-epimerase
VSDGRPSPDEGWIEGATLDRQSVTPHWDRIRDLIDGVRITEVKHVPTGYGYLTELFRPEWDPGGEGVGGAFIAVLEPGGISAWHAHAQTVDRLFVVEGMVRIVLYDARAGSRTFGRLNDDLVFGDRRPALVVIPPGVWHGIRNVSTGRAAAINFVSRAYSYEAPDHLRLPPDAPQIPYHFAGR